MSAIAIVLAFLWSSVAWSAPAEEGLKVDVGRYLEQVTAARKGLEMATTRKAGGMATTREGAREGIAIVDELGAKPGEPAYGMCKYVKCRLLVAAGQRTIAEDECLSLLDVPAFAPEAVLALLEMSGAVPKMSVDDWKKGWAIKDCLAQLVPLGGWPRLREFKKAQLIVLADPGPPVVPRLRREKLVVLAQELDRACFVDLAQEAYVEAIYYRSPGWIMMETPLREAWFSQDTAALWRRAAQNAWEAGRHRLAYDYLAKFAVFGTDADSGQTAEIVKGWESAAAQKKPEVTKEQRQQAIERAAKMYAGMNVHPRALGLIEANKAWLANSDALYDGYCKEWRAIVKELDSSDLGNETVVFDTVLSPGVDPTRIRIAPPCTPESIVSVKRCATAIVRGLPTTQPGTSTRPNSPAK